jgi:hypothetical protein
MPLFKKRFDPRSLPVYMHPVELSQVRAVFESLQPARVLEWGSGGSTREILATFPFVERLVSVEHHPDWYQLVKEQLRDPRLSLHHVLPDVPPHSYKVPAHKTVNWNRRAETDVTVMASYIAFPATLGLTYHLVLVDGRARTFCMRAGWELLEPGGVMLLHDAQRPEYQSTLASFPRAVKLEPFHQGQVAIIRKQTAGQ